LEEQTIEVKPEDLIDPIWLFVDPNNKGIEYCLTSSNGAFLAMKFKDNKNAKYFKENNEIIKHNIIDKFR